MPSCWSRRTGHLKKSFMTEAEAKRQPMNRYQTAYFCKICQHFHVGSKRKKRKTKRGRKAWVAY